MSHYIFGLHLSPNLSKNVMSRGTGMKSVATFSRKRCLSRNSFQDIRMIHQKHTGTLHLKYYDPINLKGGPLLVKKWSYESYKYRYRVITPVPHLFSALYRSYFTPIYNNRRGPPHTIVFNRFFWKGTFSGALSDLHLEDQKVTTGRSWRFQKICIKTYSCKYTYIYHENPSFMQVSIDHTICGFKKKQLKRKIIWSKPPWLWVPC